jgi:hypothetical protein
MHPMIDTLRLLLGWSKRLLTWALGAWLAFFTIGVIALALLISLSIGTEQALRLAGLCLQLLGILVAGIGIRDMRRMFGKPSLLGLLRRWVKAAPRLKPTSITVSLTDGISVGASLLSISLWSCPGPDASLEERLKALESNSETLRAQLQTAERDSSAFQQSVNGKLQKERAEREVQDRQLQARIESASTDGLHLAAAGAAWVTVGLMLSTAPSELLWLLHYA